MGGPPPPAASGAVAAENMGCGGSKTNVKSMTMDPLEQMDPNSPAALALERERKKRAARAESRHQMLLGVSPAEASAPRFRRTSLMDGLEADP